MLLPAEPINPEMGKFFIERGLFQVALFYVEGEGTASILAQAELTRNAFPKNQSFSSGGVITTIESTPQISSCSFVDGFITCAIRIRWYTHLIGV
jgi:hypothetical protein